MLGNNRFYSLMLSTFQIVIDHMIFNDLVSVLNVD